MKDYNEQYREMMEKAKTMTEDEMREHLSKPRNLSVKLHPTPYYYRNPFTAVFASFQAYIDYRGDKGYDAPGMVWMAERNGDEFKYHDVSLSSSGAIDQDGVTRGHQSSTTQRSDDWALAEACWKLVPTKVVMA